MRNKYIKINYILNFLGYLLVALSVILLIPLIFVFFYWGIRGDGVKTLSSFLIPSALSFLTGILLIRLFKKSEPDKTGSMIICGLSWLIISAFGALPIMMAIHTSFINAYFEAISGFTTTGITVLSGLDFMPRSILFWRSLIQWLGGVGILSFFLVLSFNGSSAASIVGAEAHKISSQRPVPGLANTIKITWGVYVFLTFMAFLVYALLNMGIFDSICHALTSLSTGGYSPYDASIAHYRLIGHPHYIAIEYAITFFMMLGGINFFIHYRFLTGDFKSLWDSVEIRYWWYLISLSTIIIMFNHLHRSYFFNNILSMDPNSIFMTLESTFRNTIFQVISLLTTTGFGTQDIGSTYFPALSKQIFLIFMLIGGCVGSTGGGIKVMRIIILERLMLRELFKLRVSSRTISNLVIDKETLSDDEIHRTSALFYTWIIFLVIGGGFIALLTNYSPFACFSGMFSALGNIGPCYLSVDQIIHIPSAVKLIFIIGMLVGRLEILPVLLLFSKKAWR